MTEPPPIETGCRSPPRERSAQHAKRAIAGLDLDLVVDRDVTAGGAQAGRGSLAACKIAHPSIAEHRDAARRKRARVIAQLCNHAATKDDALAIDGKRRVAIRAGQVVVTARHEQRRMRLRKRHSVKRHRRPSARGRPGQRRRLCSCSSGPGSRCGADSSLSLRPSRRCDRRAG